VLDIEVLFAAVGGNLVGDVGVPVAPWEADWGRNDKDSDGFFSNRDRLVYRAERYVET